MLTLLGYGLLAVLLAAVLFVAAAYLLPAGEQIAPVIRDEPIWDLPGERALTPDDVASVRLPVALRGYRFAETDVLLDRLADELRARDEELARLRGHEPSAEPSAEPSDEPSDQPSDEPSSPVPPDVEAADETLGQPATADGG